MNLTLASLFDGSGTAPLAASMCGITPVWASEIEPYPIRVTTKRFPHMKHYGSISDINGATVEPVDIISGGSPCQDLSVAGKQAGLDGGTRSHLFYEMTRIIKEMRHATHGRSPRFIIWENVPGAFSSNNGRDFLSVLQSFAQIAENDIHVPEPERKADKLVWRNSGEMVGDGWSIAWRTVDAQYWGVPQRRRRIYLIVDLDSERAGEILFERDGLSGNPEPSRETREGTAADAHGSVNGENNVKCLNPWDSQTIRQYSIDGVAPNLNANTGGGQNRWGVCYPVIARTLTAEHDASPCIDRGQNICVYESKSALEENWSESDVKNALRANASKSDHCVVKKACAFMGGQGAKARSIAYCEDGTTPTLKSSPSGGNTVADVCYCLQGNGIDRADTAGCNGKGWKEDSCFTLNTIDRPAVVFSNTGYGKYTEGTNTLKASGGDYGGGSEMLCVYPDNTGPLMANSHPGSYSGQDAYNDMFPVFKQKQRYIVRRLMPVECSRLQGFPDWWEIGLETENPTEEEIAFWTDVFETHRKIVNPDVKPKTRNQIVKWLKNPYSDSASYKMWGNGMALPNMRFVVERIAQFADAEKKEMEQEGEG